MSPKFTFLNKVLYWDFYNYLCLLHPPQVKGSSRTLRAWGREEIFLAQLLPPPCWSLHTHTHTHTHPAKQGASRWNLHCAPQNARLSSDHLTEAPDTPEGVGPLEGDSSSFVQVGLGSVEAA